MYRPEGISTGLNRYGAPNDLVDKVIAYESGEMVQEDVIPFFQQLVDTGLAWQLQGTYGRQAQRLIDRGLVKPQNRAMTFDSKLSGGFLG